MVIMGAHYLPFSHLYGMRIFIPLGAGMWIIGLWAPGASVVGGWLTAIALLAVGTWATIRNRDEFGPEGSGLPEDMRNASRGS